MHALTPMLGDLNRYYQEALRNVGGAHMFGGDDIERFIVQHRGLTGGARDLV